MQCPLCTEPLTQAPLTEWHGLPAHVDCADRWQRIEVDLIADLEAMIMAEPDRRAHRHRVRP